MHTCDTIPRFNTDYKIMNDELKFVVNPLLNEHHSLVNNATALFFGDFQNTDCAVPSMNVKCNRKLDENHRRSSGVVRCRRLFVRDWLRKSWYGYHLSMFAFFSPSFSCIVFVPCYCLFGIARNAFFVFIHVSMGNSVINSFLEGNSLIALVWFSNDVFPKRVKLQKRHRVNEWI